MRYACKFVERHPSDGGGLDQDISGTRVEVVGEDGTVVALGRLEVEFLAVPGAARGLPVRCSMTFVGEVI